MSNDDLRHRVQQFISEQIDYPYDRITPETRLQSDLGIDGDDGAEFLDRFQQEFVVDMSMLQYAQHFGPEGIPFSLGFKFMLIFILIGLTTALMPWLIPLWVALIYFRYRRRPSMAEICVSDLIRSAELHCWTYDYANEIDRHAAWF
jgi:acyl carrier protein